MAVRRQVARFDPCSVHMGFQVLRFLLTFQKKPAGRWIGCNKFPLGVNVCVCAALRWTANLLIIRMPFYVSFLPSTFFLSTSFSLSLSLFASLSPELHALLITSSFICSFILSTFEMSFNSWSKSIH